MLGPLNISQTKELERFHTGSETLYHKVIDSDLFRPALRDVLGWVKNFYEFDDLVRSLDVEDEEPVHQMFSIEKKYGTQSFAHRYSRSQLLGRTIILGVLDGGSLLESKEQKTKIVSAMTVEGTIQEAEAKKRSAVKIKQKLIACEPRIWCKEDRSYYLAGARQIGRAGEAILSFHLLPDYTMLSESLEAFQIDDGHTLVEPHVMAELFASYVDPEFQQQAMYAI